jgi:hypothetical protein
MICINEWIFYTDKAENTAEVVPSARLSNEVRMKKTSFKAIIICA